MTLPQTPPFPCILLTFTNFVKEVSKLLTYISYLWFPTSTWFYSSLLDNISDLHCAKPNIIWASQVVLVVKNPPANAGDTGSIPGSGRSPGRGHGNPLLYSCLENPMDKGAWQAIVHGSQRFDHYWAHTWLSTPPTHTHTHTHIHTQ